MEGMPAMGGMPEFGGNKRPGPPPPNSFIQSFNISFDDLNELFNLSEPKIAMRFFGFLDRMDPELQVEIADILSNVNSTDLEDLALFLETVDVEYWKLAFDAVATLESTEWHRLFALIGTVDSAEWGELLAALGRLGDKRWDQLLAFLDDLNSSEWADFIEMMGFGNSIPEFMNKMCEAMTGDVCTGPPMRGSAPMNYEGPPMQGSPSMKYEDEDALYYPFDPQDVEDSSWTFALTGKSVLIFVLCIINVITVVTLWCLCTKSNRRGKYQSVFFGTQK